MTNIKLSRRAFVAGATALGAAILAPSAFAQSGGLIDAHCHAWSPDVAAYPMAEGRTQDQLSPASFTVEHLLEREAAVGVSRVVLIQHIWYHGYDSSYFTDAIAAHPGRFAAVGAVGETEANAREMMIERKSQGVAGFRVRGFDTHKWVDAEVMNTMFDTAAREGLSICPLIRNNPKMDDGALRHIDALCAKHPDTVVVIDHMGTVKSDQPERMAELLALAKRANVYVKISGFNKFDLPPYAKLSGQIGQIIDAFGVDRLMWGSDLPVLEAEVPHRLSASLDLIRTGLGLSEGDQDALLRGTAEKLFF